MIVKNVITLAKLCISITTYYLQLHLLLTLSQLKYFTHAIPNLPDYCEFVSFIR